MKAFCIGLLYAKFRSGFGLMTPPWYELANHAGDTWAKTLSENFAHSKIDSVKWWDSGVKMEIPSIIFPFELKEKPGSDGRFSVVYRPIRPDDESPWAISRLELMEPNAKPIVGMRLLDFARKLETSDKGWKPILPEDNEITQWSSKITTRPISPLGIPPVTHSPLNTVRPAFIDSKTVLEPKILHSLIEPQQSALSGWKLFQRDVEIEDVYVEEVLEPSQPGIFSLRVQSHPIGEASILKDIGGKIERERQVWLMLGDAGSGKTTMLRNWVLRLLEPLSRQDTALDIFRDSIPPIPLFISLRTLSQQMGRIKRDKLDEETLASAFNATFPETVKFASTYPFSRLATLRDEQTSWHKRLTLEGLKDRSLRPPEWVLFLDGFDEMDPEVRPRLLEWVELLPRAVRVVLTSRPSLVTELSGLTRSVYYKLCDFNADQIHSFVNQWFRQNQMLANEMIRLICSNTQFGALTSVPLLLACLCLDVEVRQKCDYPEDFVRVTVYRRIIGILLHEWEATKAHQTLNHREIEFGMRFLSELAVHFSYDTPMRFHDLWSHAQPVAASLAIPNEGIELLLLRIMNSGRLLIRDTSFGVNFSHKAFHDFFFSEGVRSLMAMEAERERRASYGQNRS